MSQAYKPDGATTEYREWQLLNEATLALRQASSAEYVLTVLTESLSKFGFFVIGGELSARQTQVLVTHVSYQNENTPFGAITPAQTGALLHHTIDVQTLSFFEALVARGDVVFTELSPAEFEAFFAPLLTDHTTKGVRHCIIAPIRVNKKNTHMLVITAADLSADIVPTIAAFSNLGSAILENLRLLRQEKEQRQISQTLQNVSNIVNSTLELDTVLNLILEQLETVVPYDSAAIMLERTNVLKLEAGRGFGADQAIFQVEVPIDTNVLYNEMKRTHRPIVIGDVHKDPRYMLWEGTSPIHSWIGTPIIWQDKIIGQISVDNFAIDAFTPEQGELAYVFAQHVAAAINNARLFRRARRTAEELRALLNSARDVASTLETEKVMSAIAARVNDLMHAQFTAIYLIARDMQTLRTVIQRDETDNPVVAASAKNGAELAVNSKEGVIINRPTHEKQPLSGAMIAVPFIIMDRVIGAMVTFRTGDAPFHPADLDLLNRFALQTGIAIENSRLYEQVERRLKRQALLNRLSRRLSSKLSLSALAQDIMQTAQTIAEADAAALVILNPADENMFLQYTHNFPQADGVTELTQTPALVEKVMTEQKVVVSNNLAGEAFHSPPWFDTSITGIIAVPLTSGGDPLGVLGLITHTQPIQSAIEILNTVEAIGRQAGVAVENAMLFQQVNNYAQNLAEQVEERTAEIRAQKEQTDAILAAAGDAIIITDAEGIIEYVNPAFTTLTGYYPEEVIGENPSILQSGQTSPHIYTDMWHTVLAGKTWRGEMKNQCKDGRVYDADLTIAPIFNRQGKVSKLVGIQRDISKLRELDRMKTEFLGTAAHELRSPLTTVRGYAELLMLRTDFSADEVRKFVGYIHEQAVHLANLVSDLLDVSKIEAGAAFPITPVKMNPRDIFVKQVREWQSRTNKHNIILHEPDEWVELSVDEARLTQTLNNLLSNAIKYSPGGGEISVTVTRTPVNLHVAVKDNGIGMSLDEQKHVFEKFWRADASSTAIEGTGLGMVIVKHIIESHGGKIWLVSQKGEGTTITFTLPLVPGVATVLIIEDEPSILEIQQRLLEAESFQVLTAVNGEEGLAQILKHHPDLIILDLMLPKMTGEDVLRRIKTIPATKDIPVVVVSARSGLAQIEKTFSLGATDFITKPFSTEEYISRIKLALSK